jgi:hypothetical protein
MLRREAAQSVFSRSGEVDQDGAPVSLAVLARNQPALFHSVQQLNGAVMLDLESFGDHPNRRMRTFRKPFDCEQTLVLLRFHASGSGRVFAKVDELPKPVAHVGQRPVHIKRNFSAILHLAAHHPASETAYSTPLGFGVCDRTTIPSSLLAGYHRIRE